jgi:LysM repeat protein
VRRSVIRFAGPVAVLAAITAAALLVRPALEPGSAPQRTTPKAGATITATSPTTAHQRHRVRTYRVESGDTFSAIARKTGSTVTLLEQLNPGVDPTALQVGQKIRVQ